MRKRIIGILLCIALMCTLLPCAFAAVTATFNPTEATSWSCQTESGVYTVNADENDTITVPANPEKTGYVFKGWGTVRNNKSSIVQIEAGKSLTLEKNEIFYAIWEGFTLSPSTLSLYTNSSAAEIKATDVLPAGETISWSVEPSGVVTLTTSADTYTCTVTPAAAGTATITATCGSFSKTCAVTVTAESLNLSDSKLALNTDTTKVGLITATTVPSAQVVEWKSSDETVAKVIPSADTKSCTVSALKAGNATVTATSGTKTATCAVTVTDSSVATAISLSPEKLSLVVGSTTAGTGTLKATVTPSTSAEVIKWKSSDETVATVAPSNDTYQTSATVTAKKAGTATITAYVGDGTTIYDTCTVTAGSPAISFTLPTTKFTSTDSYTISATTSPATGGTVTWKSSDTSVMTVTKDSSDSTGRTAIIKPVKSGSVQITASYTADSGVTVSKSQSTTVSLTNNTYKVIYNANGSWYYDSPSSYQIKVNAPYTKTIKSVSIYNKQLGTTYYPVIGTDVTKQYDTSYPNQTILTFTKAFMQTLPRYTYQVMTITFEDGTATTYLHILSTTDSPVTGDVQFNPYWIMLALGATGLGAALTLRKKEDY